MDKSIAKRKFREADELYKAKEYAASLVILEGLDEAFPDNHRVMFPMARCLHKLDRHDEAFDLCERLVEDMEYEPAEPLFRKLKGIVYAQENEVDEDDFEDEKEPRFKIKPLRLIVLIGLIAAMVMGYLPYWLGGGLIAVYFILKWIIGRIILKMFSAPFIMKGKALEGAGATVHNITVTQAPAHIDPRELPKMGSCIYYIIDATISPQAPKQGGFTHWEPGELCIIPLAKRVKSLDDLDGHSQVLDVRIQNGEAASPADADDSEDEDDGGGKYVGPQTLRFTVALPHGGGDYKFAYYMETFGQFTIPPA